MRSSRSKTAVGLALMLVGFFMLISGAAFAQGIPQSLNELTSATPPDDWSMRMWRSLFGEFADNPFSTLGAPTTLLGSVFIIFNGCIFVVGFAWALYGILSGVVGTAHEGEVLGKRMSTVWFPIRMVTGIAGMVPIFGGFTINQAIMMFLTTIGIGIGNLMWVGAVNSTAEFQGLMNNQAFSPTAIPAARQVARDVFAANVCILSETDLARDIRLPDEHIPGIRPGSSLVEGVSFLNYGTEADLTKCGKATVKGSRNWESGSAGIGGAGGRGADNFLAFRSGAVDYRAIEGASMRGQIAGLSSLQSQMAPLAAQWYAARTNAMAQGVVAPSVPIEEIEAQARQFVVTSSAEMQRFTNGQEIAAIEAAARRNMLSVGWFGAGSWFSTFAETNAALADAAKTVKLESSGPTLSDNLGSTTNDALETLYASFGRADDMRAGNLGGDRTRALLDSAIEDSCSVGGFSVASLGNATGNCSLGQSIVSAALRATATGSGGGGDGAGRVGFDQQGLVNPVIMMKNMGDYVMSYSSTILLGSSVMEAAASGVGKVAEAARGVPVVGKYFGAVTEAAAGAASSFFAVIKVIAVITLVLGAAMAIYIPMIPFITWIGAILAYAASMIEGLAGATLHSMAHLDGDGEGMGQRTAHGYMFYINAVARPGLMIIGFFFASAIMISVGTLQAQMFLPAMANVQGNSMTGLFSVAMFLVIFFVINLTLITSSFNLIYVITDQVIGFVGGSVAQKLGQDTEDKANNMFLLAARVGPSAMGQIGAVKAESNRAGSAVLDRTGKASGNNGRAD